MGLARRARQAAGLRTLCLLRFAPRLFVLFPAEGGIAPGDLSRVPGRCHGIGFVGARTILRRPRLRDPGVNHGGQHFAGCRDSIAVGAGQCGCPLSVPSRVGRSLRVSRFHRRRMRARGITLVNVRRLDRLRLRRFAAFGRARWPRRCKRLVEGRSDTTPAPLLPRCRRSTLTSPARKPVHRRAVRTRPITCPAGPVEMLRRAMAETVRGASGRRGADGHFWTKTASATPFHLPPCGLPTASPPSGITPTAPGSR